MSQKQYKLHYLSLKKKWLDRHKDLQKSIWEKHKESLDWIKNRSAHVVVGSMAGLIMMTHPANAAVLPAQVPSPDKQMEEKVVHKVDKKSLLEQALTGYLPQEVIPLTSDQENILGQKLSDIFEMQVSAVENGIRLNRSYGYIGQEQHLMRYPGDNMDTHFTEAADAQIVSKGMAPGRGAWGYFVAPGQLMAQKDIDREKYYIAVPTFMAPGYNEHVGEYSKFFKFHKMLVVNPDNKKAMVVVIGDSGPAPFTGKHLGGSPEVMQYLERVDGAGKGPVLYFFINDPDDKVPLGPLSL